jgi:tetratricopeptide (TPR) repeat protein
MRYRQKLSISISIVLLCLGVSLVQAKAEKPHQEHLLQSLQKQQGIELSQERQSIEEQKNAPQHDLAAQENELPQEVDASEPRRSKEAICLEIGWWKHNKGDNDKALILFRQAAKSDDPAVTNEAMLGLAYVFMKRNEKSQAIPLVEDLVQQRYRLEETAPMLVDLLLAQKNYQKAEKYLPLLR